MTTLAEFASKIVSAALPQKKIRYGPWRGSRRSQSADQVSRDFIATGSNFLYQPSKGYWKRRKGQTQKFDTFGSSVGLLDALWGKSAGVSKCRQMEEFVSDSVTDGVPTVCALVTSETVTGTDSGRFSNFWVRDQVNGLNYVLGNEFNTTLTYPAPGTVQTLKHAPLWYDSGDGGISRGVTEFQRRLMLNGSRSFMKVGTQHYFPSLYGTPSRWNSRFTAAGALSQTSYASVDQSGGSAPPWGKNTGTAFFSLIDDDPDSSASDTDFMTHTSHQGSEGNVLTLRTSGTLISDPGVDTGFKIKIRCKCSTTAETNRRMMINLKNVTGGTSILDFDIAIGGDNNTNTTGQVTWTRASDGASVTKMSTSFDEYTYTLNATEGARVDFASQRDYSFTYAGTTSTDATINISSFQFSVGAVTSPESNRLMPSGPIPPTHCGYITKGTAVAGTSPTTANPNGDISTGGWTTEDGVSTSNLYTKIDELNTTADPITSDYIRAYGASTSTYIATLTPFAFTPGADDVVKLRWKAYRNFSSTNDLAVSLTKSDGTVIASSQQTLQHGIPAFFEYTLTDAEKAAVSDWTTLRLKLVNSGGGGSDLCVVQWAELEFTPVGSALGGWHGSDRFPFALAYKWRDDKSTWAYTVPRLPSTALVNGIGIFTVDATNPTQGYDKITWTLPVPPAGVDKVVMLRGTKIDSTTEDNLQMDLNDLRVVDEVDAGVTSYDDYAADDDSLLLDVDELTVHQDHIMPPRARWNFPGDSRVCHAYGGINPAAITLAPAGFTADFDLADEADTSTTAYAAANASYYKLTSTGLTLVWDNGSTTSTRTFAFATYTTLQKLVDAINATSVSDTDWSGGAGKATQWRAQVLPGVSPDVASTYLCPTSRTIASCVVSGQTITKAAGGLSAIPVGAFVQGTGVTDGAYISAITSDTSLTFVGTITAATKSLDFNANTGDAITGATHSTYEGYVRVIANSFPGFLYFTKTYLNLSPVEKSAVWMTSASPESNKSAANCFKGLGANKHTPPEAAGIAMGGVGVGNGFVVGFSGKRGVIVNTRDSGTGRDSDYRLIMTHESSGVCGPIVKGNRCAFAFAPEGWVAADLQGEIPFSDDIYLHPRSDAVTGVGDFAYEAAQCVAAAGSDTDTAMMCARVMRGALWVNYRKLSGSTTHPDAQVCFDMSASKQSGPQMVLRDAPVVADGKTVIPAGVTWGWSLPLTSRSLTAMCEGRRSDGSHLYGWNQANAGSLYDGRVDEFETSDTDNGTAISASLTTPWESFGDSDNIAAREIVFEHDSPSGATVQGQFSRSFTGDAYTCTPDVSSTLVVSVYRWLLSLSARVHSAACTVGWAQTAGGASELRSIELRASSVRDLRGGTAG